MEIAEMKKWAADVIDARQSALAQIPKRPIVVRTVLVLLREYSDNMTQSRHPSSFAAPAAFSTLTRSRARRFYMYGAVAGSLVIFSVMLNVQNPSLESISSQLDDTLKLMSLLNVTNDSSSYTPAKVPYAPAKVESYIIENSQRLGYDTEPGVDAPACTIWRDESATTIYDDLHSVRKEMSVFAKRLRTIKSPVPDLRLAIEHDRSICDKLGFGKGVEQFFPSGQLSYISGQGYVEPIVPPLRHPMICEAKRWELNLDYILHDFPTICRSLKRTSRTIFVDMGASLQFHGNDGQPAVYLTHLYRQFGIPFDHIYAYEVTPTPSEEVFKKIPKHMRAAYHWINVGVAHDPTSEENPWNILRESFNEDDFIVVKLDIDTPSVEMPLVNQLLEREDLHRLVDQFYFEHHVQITEMNTSWIPRNGSLHESLTLFHELRKKGIAAHSWV